MDLYLSKIKSATLFRNMSHLEFTTKLDDKVLINCWVTKSCCWQRRICSTVLSALQAGRWSAVTNRCWIFKLKVKERFLHIFNSLYVRHTKWESGCPEQMARKATNSHPWTYWSSWTWHLYHKCMGVNSRKTICFRNDSNDDNPCHSWLEPQWSFEHKFTNIQSWKELPKLPCFHLIGLDDIVHQRDFCTNVATRSINCRRFLWLTRAKIRR